MIAVAGAVLGAPAAANADPAGQLTKATADPGWTRGQIAGTVTCHDCIGGPAGGVRWIPVVTVQPALPSYACDSDDWASNDPNISVAWSGGGRTANGAVDVDVRDVPLLPGVAGQRACLIVIWTVRRRNPVCVAHAPIFGQNPEDCPLEEFTAGRLLSSRLFEVEQPQAQPPASDGPPPSQGEDRPPQSGGERPDDTSTRAPSTAPPRTTKLTLATARRRATSALARRYGRVWRSGNARRVSCRRQSQTVVRCRVSWRAGKRHYTGTVTVRPQAVAVSVRRVRGGRP